MTEPPELPPAARPKEASLVGRVGKWIAIGFGVIIALGVCGSLLAGDEEGATTGQTAVAATPTEASEPTGTSDPSPTVVTSAVGATTTTTLGLPEGSFGDGILIVGEDVMPGIYISPTGSCYWARLSGFSGAFEEIIANDNPSGQAIVTISENDVGFESNGCGLWVPLTDQDSQPADEFGEGFYAVGIHVAPGLYEASGSDCYWQRVSSFDGGFDAILANDTPSGHAIVEISETDAGFASSRCGTWSPIDESVTPSSEFDAGVWMVGVHIEPGLYEAPGGDGCYWQRMSGFSGYDLIANDLPSGPEVVEILSSDVGFASSRCGVWTKR